MAHMEHPIPRENVETIIVRCRFLIASIQKPRATDFGRTFTKVSRRRTVRKLSSLANSKSTPGN